MATLLLGAGFETTRNGIAGGILALLTHPGELAQLRDDPSIDKSMVDEVLRFVSPNQTAVARFALEDIDVFGTPVPKGAVMAPVIAAANRDPARFADPDRLDIDRPDNLPLTFAPGPHLCLGAPVARLEVELALSTLARRFPNLELLDDDPADAQHVQPRPRPPRAAAPAGGDGPSGQRRLTPLPRGAARPTCDRRRRGTSARRRTDSPVPRWHRRECSTRRGRR